jgi:hypothetical protein
MPVKCTCGKFMRKSNSTEPAMRVYRCSKCKALAMIGGDRKGFHYRSSATFPDCEMVETSRNTWKPIRHT